MQWLQTDVDNQHPSHTFLLLSCQSEHNQYLMLIRNTQYYQCLTCERGLPNCQYFESQYYLAFVLINGRNDFAASNQVTKWTWRCLQKSSLSSIVASFAHLLENCEDEPKEAVDELDDREDGSSDPETQVPTDRPQERCKTLDIFSFAQYFIRLVLFFIQYRNTHRCMLDGLYEVKGWIVNLTTWSKDRNFPAPGTRRRRGLGSRSSSALGSPSQLGSSAGWSASRDNPPVDWAWHWTEHSHQNN